MPRTKRDYKAVIESLVLSEFAASGYILNKHYIEKISGVPAHVVRAHHDEAIAKIPDRDVVEGAYASFLDVACEGELTDELVRLGGEARLTGRRIAEAVRVEADEVAGRAAALGVKLSETELPYAAASRLTPEAARRLSATGLSKTRLKEVCGVPITTFELRLRAAEAVAVIGSDPVALATDGTGDGSAAEPSADDWDLGFAEPAREIVASPDPVRIGMGFDGNTISRAAREILVRDGRDPDVLVAGTYCAAGSDRLECDRIEMIDGRPTPLVAAYRLEAEKIASMLDLLKSVAAEPVH